LVELTRGWIPNLPHLSKRSAFLTRNASVEFLAYPPLRRIINLFEPDGPERATGIEDGRDADFSGEFSVLDNGCHAEIMGELPGGGKGDISPMGHPR